MLGCSFMHLYTVGLWASKIDAMLPACLSGIGLGCIAAGATEVTDSMMLAAAQGISHKLTAEELERESVLPRIVRLRCVCSVAPKGTV